tara:strand:- start:16337 stop:16786 length:450 start_codon:yes stop_codon:yes gene_type:complete
MSSDHTHAKNQHRAQEPSPEPPVNAQGKAYDPDASTDERSFAMFMHLALLLNLTGVGGVVAFIVVLVMWITRKDESAFLDDHGREAMNFQISLFIWGLILTFGAIVTCGASLLFLIVIPIVGAIGMVLAAMAANRGEFFRYPATFRFIH